ncbi:MAG: hypothetical protein M1816_007792 [Peltula sp. TS41687]|nr:MAG: hypothetical protein M1816_007792 [Peltula sp. TS41687]
MPRPGPLALSISDHSVSANIVGETSEASQSTTPSSIASSGDRIMSAPLGPLENENTKYRLPDEVSGIPKVMSTIRELASVRAEEHQMMTPKPQTSSYQDPPPSDPSSPSMMRSPLKRTNMTTTEQPDLQETPDITTLLNRNGSVSTLTRPSVFVQLETLASQLSEATTFSTSIASVSSLSNASDAAKCLAEMGEQIRGWIRKTVEIARGFDPEDDVQWSLSAGREGMSSIDRSVDCFEEVICLYVVTIEDIQLRSDITDVLADELKVVVEQMESTVSEWKGLRAALKKAKEQIELAMEWEELSNAVFQDISGEIDDLNKFIFETEERRHKILIAEMHVPPENSRPGSSELDSIMEKTSLTDCTPSSPWLWPTAADTREDSNLVALVARMQPLRASLDFLPMRLSSYHLRAQATFPTACLELQSRRKGLESRWAELEADAQSLKRELTEDRYVFVFRNAAAQAQKMCQSLSRSLIKLQEAIRLGTEHRDPPSFMLTIENYEAKKTHYGPSVERVLAIIGRGIKDRLTANGEILRLQSDVEGQWKFIQDQMRRLDLEILKSNLRKYQPRLSMSMSSAVSVERPNSSTTVDETTTRETSPASSIIQLPKRGATPSLLPRPILTPNRRDFNSRCSSVAGIRSPSLSGRLTPSLLPRPIIPPNSSVGASRRSSSSIWPSARSVSVAIESPLANVTGKPKWRSASSNILPRPMSVANTHRDPYRRSSTTAWPSSPLSSVMEPKRGPRWRPSPSLLPQLPQQPISSSASNSRDSSRRSSTAAVWPSTPSSTIAVDSPSSMTGMQLHLPSSNHGTKPRWSLPSSKAARPASRQVTQTPMGSHKKASMTTTTMKSDKPRWRF